MCFDYSVEEPDGGMPWLCLHVLKAHCGKVSWCAVMLVLTGGYFLVKHGFVAERCIFSQKNEPHGTFSHENWYHPSHTHMEK